MLTEKEVIKIFANRLGITDLDDVAQLGRGLAFKADMLVASTDVPSSMKPWQIARKSIVSCVSDLTAKGIKPYAALVSIGIPKNCTRAYVEGLAEGFWIASKEFGVKVVGGDTNEASGLVIDCSMIGFSKGKIPTRKGARPGDVVIASGLFGLAPAGLAILMQNAKASGAFRKLAIESVLEPKPNQRFGIALARYFSSSIDSSDGFAISLYELANQSRVKIVIENVPIVRGVEQFAEQNGYEKEQAIFYGGEEYEILATIPKSKLRRAVSTARKVGVSLHIIGRVHRGTGQVFVGKKLLENKGYSHFMR